MLELLVYSSFFKRMLNMDEDTLRRAAVFVSAESGFNCPTITNAQYAAARRRLDGKLHEVGEVGEDRTPATLRPAPRAGRNAVKQSQQPNRTASAGQGRSTGYSAPRSGIL
jgi:hypothetical protein